MRRTRWQRAVGGAGLAVLIASGGCLKTDKTHTLYVGADGAVSWMVVERDVHSDEKDPAKADAEEQEYLAHARAGDHPVARAFRLLGASEPSTRIIREEVPFLVTTTAGFRSLEAVGQGFIDALHADATSTLDVNGGRTRWVLEVWSDVVPEGAPEVDVTPLIDEPWRVALQKGRFIAAEGFRIEDGGRVAIRRDDLDDPKPGEPLVLSLTWQQ